MRKIGRQLVLGTIALILVVFPGTVLPGCSGSSASVTSPAGLAAPVGQAPSTTSTTVSSSALQKLRIAKHARIMAEQGRGTAQTGPDGSVNAAPGSGEAQTGPAVPPTQMTQTAQDVAQSQDVTQPQSLTAAGASATRTILGQGQTPLRGTWAGTAEQLAAFLLAESPDPRFTVEVSTLAGYYVRYCAETGLRADLLWAQMIHETGYGRYGGSVAPQQNNYAGIGATGGGEPGIFFVSAEAGVLAHVAHMVAYVYGSSPVAWADPVSDPRFDMVAPKGAAAVLADLNGRWAVPGTSYGQAIEEIARRINTGG